MKSALLSKIAMCVCPPAIVATSAVTVPPVKRAVHRLTAPAHAPVTPKPRRVFNAAYNCTPTAVPLTSAPSAMNVVAPTDSTGVAPDATGVAAETPTALSVRPAQPVGFAPVALETGPFVGPVLPGTTTTGTPTPPPTPPAAVPELSTWAMTITGFGAIGWAMRRKGRTMDTTIEVA